MTIRSYGDAVSREILEDRKAGKGFPADLVKVARRKLVLLDAAKRLGDLKVPPGNRLEELKGDLKGYHSIRINDQWRIVFQWTAEGPKNVRIDDYH
jgi:proteic killer suppression protein